MPESNYINHHDWRQGSQIKRLRTSNRGKNIYKLPPWIREAWNWVAISLDVFELLLKKKKKSMLDLKLQIEPKNKVLGRQKLL